MPKDETIYDKVLRLRKHWESDPDKEPLLDHLPILVAAEEISRAIYDSTAQLSHVIENQRS